MFDKRSVAVKTRTIVFALPHVEMLFYNVIVCTCERKQVFFLQFLCSAHKRTFFILMGVGQFLFCFVCLFVFLGGGYPNAK